MPSPDACARCSHPRDLHVTSCRQSWQEPDSETGPAGTYVCGCDRFVEPPSHDASGDVRGVPVWRFPEAAATCGYCYAGFRTPKADEPGSWHSLSDKAQAARREAVARAISGGAELENWDYATAAAVLRVLGLGGDADATNGGG